MKQLSLKKTFIFLELFLLTIVVVSLLLTRSLLRKNVLKQIEHHHKQTATYINDQTNRIIESEIGLFKALLSLADKNGFRIDRDTITENTKFLSNVFIVNKDLNIERIISKNHSSNLVGIDISSSKLAKYIKTVQKTKQPVYSSYMQSIVSGDFIIALIMPNKDRVYVCEIDARKILSVLKYTFHELYINNNFLIVNPDNDKIIYRSSAIYPYWNFKTTDNGEVVLNKKRYLVSQKLLKALRIKLIVLTPKKPFTKPLEQFQLIFLILSAIIIIFSLFRAGFLFKGFISPIGKFLKAFKKKRSVKSSSLFHEWRVLENEYNSALKFSTTVINKAPSIICGISMSGETTFINPAGEMISGYSLEEISGKNWWKLLFPNYKEDYSDELFDTSKKSGYSGKEMVLLRKDGTKRIIVWNFIKRAGPGGDNTEIIGFGSDITERKRAEEGLSRLRNYLSNIIDSMPSILVGVDVKGTVTQWNSAAVDATGIEASFAHGKSLVDVFPKMDSEMERITQSIDSHEIVLNKRRQYSSEKGLNYEDVTIYPLVANGVEGAVIRIDDVTEKMKMEEMVIQSEKMLSVGGLAAGMAHEINNPLAGMIQTANVMENRLGGNLNMPANIKAAKEAGVSMENIRKFIELRGIPRMILAINESGKQIATIVENMLSFSRKSDVGASSHSLGELMDKSLELAGTDYDLKKHYDFKMIKIHKEYGAKIPLIVCESAKIQQVLLNILRNGAHAMHDGKTQAPSFILRIKYNKKRRMVCIEIEDNGPGMSEEIRKRIFEPFFTTKPVGLGTGLGLSVSYFIITQNHKGEMDVNSIPGGGAKFIIRLPISGK
jgi:PAS domain S-box-containing protein